MIWTAKKSMKDKCYTFRRYKQTNKVLFVYFQCKRQEDRYGWCIFKLNCQKTVERIYLEPTKQQK